MSEETKKRLDELTEQIGNLPGIGEEPPSEPVQNEDEEMQGEPVIDPASEYALQLFRDAGQLPQNMGFAQGKVWACREIVKVARQVLQEREILRRAIRLLREDDERKKQWPQQEKSSQH